MKYRSIFHGRVIVMEDMILFLTVPVSGNYLIIYFSLGYLLRYYLQSLVTVFRKARLCQLFPQITDLVTTLYTASG